MNFEQERLAYDEIEISISQIIKKCVEQIKWILILGMISAIVFPCFMYLKDIREYDALLQGTTIENLSGGEREEIEKYYYLYNTLKNFEDYGQNSPIMKIDFGNVYQGELQYRIKADEGLKEDIAAAITQYFFGQAFIEDFCSGLENVDENYAKELFELEVPDIYNGIVSIRVISASEEECRTYTESIKKAILLKSDDLQQVIGTHELVLIQEDISSGYSYNVYELQNRYNEKLKSEGNNLRNHIATLSDAQKLVIMDAGYNDLTLSYTSVNSPRFDIKYALVGLCLGVLIGIVITIMFVLFSGRLQTDNELIKRFDLIHIGNINKGHSVEQLEMSVEKIVMNKNINSIGFITTLEETPTEELRELISFLEEENIKCSILGNVVSQKEAIKKMSNDIPVIMIEAIGKSRVKEIYKEVIFCKDMSVNVLGYICLAE